jgi:hypothetical protein
MSSRSAFERKYIENFVEGIDIKKPNFFEKLGFW